MSTPFLRNTIQSSLLRRSIFKPSTLLQQNIRQFHYTSPKMTVHNITTTQEWKDALKNNKIVMLDCFATWCGPCKAIAPMLVNHSNDEQFKDIFFAKIDVDELPEVSQELGIRAMPTFMLFKDGEKAEELVGANPQALVGLLKKGAGAEA
ncbi:Thioredoxin [Apiospora rasikravindrae]|uniref:Thioredoxin n=1 Tax=Apiospora rasikravindrae TaxID=990691 RepID=A0ABR1TYT9_9PEZI